MAKRYILAMLLVLCAVTGAMVSCEKALPVYINDECYLKFVYENDADSVVNFSFAYGEKQIDTVWLPVRIMGFTVDCNRPVHLRQMETGTTDAVSGDDVPYDIEGYITEINTDAIDADYMNANFTKWRKQLQEGASKEEIEQTLNELHKSFASMTQEEQKYANLFLHDVESGEVQVEEGKTLRDYITEYQTNAKNDQIHRFAIAVGVNEDSLRAIMAIHPTEATINEYGRFDALKASVDIKIAQQYFESAEGKPIPTFKINIKLDELLRKFIFAGGFEILRRRT